jgi:ABC-type glycerol-3-phosphate transport system substrate-binding protein
MLRTLRWLLLASVMSTSVHAVDLVVWHDKGDDGIKMFSQIAAEYKRTHPDVNITSLSFPTDQWFSKTIAGLNTNTAPDLLFNDYVRIARIQLTTKKIEDLRPVFAKLPEADRKFLRDLDLKASTYDGAMVMLPVQRVLIGWGVRRSWLESVNEKPPVTWDDTLRVARKFQAGGGGRFGIASQAGDPDSLIGSIENFMLGSGIVHPTLDDSGKVMIDQPANAKVLIEYMKLFTDYKLVSPDTINHGFVEMYQMIEGSKGGMFRTGNWNVAKWDREALKGDYVVTPYPSFAGGNGSLILFSMRGIAVPTNSPHLDAANEFARFMLTRDAQAISMANMGGAIRDDYPIDQLSEHAKFFVQTKQPVVVADFPEASFPWYPRFKPAYYKLLVAAINSPPSDWNAWVKTTAAQLQEEVARLKK